MYYEIIPATGEPVTLERAKAHLNIEADFTGDDELLQGYIDAAVSDREAYLGREMYEGRMYAPTTLEGFDFEAWADASATVQYSVENEEEGFDYATLDPENYTFRKLGNSKCRIDFKGTLPVPYASAEYPIKVNITTTCPKAVVSAILLVIGDLYERREDRGEVGNNKAADSLCRNFKKWA